MFLYLFRITYLETQIDQSAIENFKTQIASLKLTQGKVLKDIEQLNQDKADHKQIFDETAKINDIIKVKTFQNICLIVLYRSILKFSEITIITV